MPEPCLSELAKTDLEQIRDSMAKLSVSAADRMLGKICKAAPTFAAFPMMVRSR